MNDILIIEVPTVIPSKEEDGDEPALINLSEIAAVTHAGNQYCAVHLKSGAEVHVALSVAEFGAAMREAAQLKQPR